MSKRETDQEPPPELHDWSAWEKHPRLTYHERCLRSSKHPNAVLKRYEKNAQENQRYLVHVASWVALLPEDSELLRPCVDLLKHLLSTRSRYKLQPWLRGSLGLVMRRMSRFGALDVSWAELKKQMPRRIIADVELSQERKEAERFQKEMTKWQNAGTDDKIAIFQAAREKLATATALDTEEGQRQKLITIVLRKMVAAMAPPKKTPKPKQQATDTTDTSQQSTAAGPGQHDLRQVLLDALPWIQKQDNMKLRPIVSYLVELIDGSALPLELAAYSEQWLQIGAFLDGFPRQLVRHLHGRWSEDEKHDVWDFLEYEVQYGGPTARLWKKASQRFCRSPSSIEAFYNVWSDPRYAPPEASNLKHERGLIKAMVEIAMGKLGEATSSELINFIRKNPEIQKTYGHSLQKHMTKINGNMYSIKAWEKIVRTNVDRYFDITGKKRDGRVIYKPKKYYRLVIAL